MRHDLCGYRSAARRLIAGVIALLFLLVGLSFPCSAQISRTKLFLILCDGLKLEDVLPSESDSHGNNSTLTSLATSHAIGLMNVKVNGTWSAVRARATLFTGRQLKPDETPKLSNLQQTLISDPADDPVHLSQRALASEQLFTLIEIHSAAVAPDGPAHDQALRKLNTLIYLLEAGLGRPLEADILLVSGYPPLQSRSPDRPKALLTPVLAEGPGFPSGLLTSATTRTPGLIANVDLAPTLLKRFGLPSDIHMTGRTIQEASAPADSQNRLVSIRRLDFVSQLNDRGLHQFIPGYGFVLGALLLGLILLVKPFPRLRPALIITLLYILTLPLVLLLAPLLVPPTYLEYCLRIIAWMAGLTFFCLAAGRLLRQNPATLLSGLTLLVVAVDLCIQQPLLKSSLLSDYPLSGIRYYGLGNEYLGAMLGFALYGGLSWLESGTDAKSHIRKIALLLSWLILTLLWGWPGTGANAGSLLVTCAGFGTAALILSGRRVTPGSAVIGVLAGLILAAVGGWLETRYSAAGASSHVGAALQTASGGGGLLSLVEIAGRKIVMNFRLLLSPYLLLAAFGIGMAGWLGWRLLGSALRATLVQRPLLQKAIPCFLVTAIASLIFKDSGVVTCTFFCGVSLLSLLFDLMRSLISQEKQVQSKETPHQHS